MTAVGAELGRLRDSIDNIDAAVVHLLAERFTHTRRVGELKARHGLPPADPGREARQIARLRSIAESARLDPAFAEKFLNFIVAEVIRHHESIARNTKGNTAPNAAGNMGANTAAKTAEQRIPAAREEALPEPVLAEY